MELSDHCRRSDVTAPESGVDVVHIRVAKSDRNLQPSLRVRGERQARLLEFSIEQVFAELRRGFELLLTDPLPDTLTSPRCPHKREPVSTRTLFRVGEDLDRIAEVDEQVNAWVSVDSAGALATAAEMNREANDGMLRGPLHGGANEAAMELIERFSSPEEATRGVLDMLANKEKIMGFGHRVYTTSDPRNGVNKKMSAVLSEEAGDTHLYAVSEAIEKVMWDEKRLFANADFFAASVYHFMGIPTYLFTPIFVCSRITGWAAHVMEQRANNKLIRPAADYTGPGLQTWVPLDER